MDLGVELFHYLPENAFEVRLPQGVSAADLKAAGVRAFTAWTPRMKLDGPLSIGDIPSWAVLNDGTIAVQFLTAPEFSKSLRYTKGMLPLQDGWYTASLKIKDLENWPKNLMYCSSKRLRSQERLKMRTAVLPLEWPSCNRTVNLPVKML